VLSTHTLLKTTPFPAAVPFVQRPHRRGGRRPREEDGDAPAKTKRGRQPKFIPLSQNVDFSLGSSLDGDSARETYKCVLPDGAAGLWGGCREHVPCIVLHSAWVAVRRVSV
jgi:hypothetical protein